MACILGGAVALAVHGSVAGAAVPDAEPRFAVAGYDVSGAEFLPASLIASTLAPFAGEGQDFDSIQQAVEALQRLLQDHGYHTARVFLPEQEVADGRIRLRVVVAVLGRLEVEGNTHHDEANILGSVPSLKPGVAPDTEEIAAELRVANENPSKQTRLVFRQSRQDGEVDAVLRVADESPLRVGLLLDNTGNEATGSYRIGILAQHANLFNADHALSAQAITSPGHSRDVLIAGIGYRLPLYRLGDSMDFALGYSNVDSGSVASAAGDFDISGSGRIASVRYNHFLPRWGELDHKLILGFDRRAYSNEIRPSGTGAASLVPDITVRPASISYAPVLRFEGGDGSANLGYARNIPGGSNGSEEDFARPGIRQGADPEYSLWRYGGNLSLRLFEQWQLRGELNGQWTRDLLVPGEQFGIGGADSVRGFGERAVAGDTGVRGSLELLTPNLAGALGFDNFVTRLLIFADAGEVRQNQPQPGELQRDGIASYGLGLRMSIGRTVSARVDAARVVYGDGTTLPGDHRLHGQLFLVF
jgi:hemolysin activation/secretion protein